MNNRIKQLLIAHYINFYLAEIARYHAGYYNNKPAKYSKRISQIKSDMKRVNNG